jgi:hypothetical protein
MTDHADSRFSLKQQQQKNGCERKEPGISLLL